MSVAFPSRTPNARPASHPLSQHSLPLEVWGATDKGLQREGNEDTIYPSADMFTPNEQNLARRGQLLIVADGVGGARAGAEASRWAVRVAVERYYDLTGPSLGNDLRTAIEMANASLYQYLQSTGVHNAGCTMAAALIHNNMLYVANVGDSRVYLIRNGQITQLTRDHTLAQQKLDQGLIRPEQAALDPDSSVLTRSLGSSPAVRVDLFDPQPLAPGDVVLVCSDGLTDMVAADHIPSLIGNAPLTKAARRLIDAANRQGGVDNISVVLARVGGRPAAARVAARPAPARAATKTPLLVGLIALAAMLAFALIAALSFAYYSRRPNQPPPASTPVPSPTTLALQVGPATETPLPTDTVPPGHPTSTPRPTSTPVPSPSIRPGRGTPSPTEATGPIPAGQPRLLSPEAGTTTGNPVSFRWEGRLSPGQAYRLVAYHPQSGEQVTSPLIVESWWETHLPAARAGEWRWYVEVVGGGQAIARSAEWMFWFEPVKVAPGTPPTPMLERE